MIYPKHLHNNSKIGVVALSAGVGYHLADYKKSLKSLENNNFNIIETQNVRSKEEVSAPPKVRAQELDELITDKMVDAIMCATGGDFLIEILPYVNYENIKNNPKWIMGASDPTSLLYVITTKLDIATIYGHNASSFDATNLHSSQKNSLEILKGNILEQNSYLKYESDKSKRTDGYALDTEVKWETLNGDVDITGRIIGGCIDCLRDLIGTKFDNTKNFIKKYKNDGIIWYFDIFALTSEDFYRTLLQMKEASWFSYIKGVIVGRVKYPNAFTSMTYQKALERVFNNISVIYNADIGHVAPKMTIINGSIAHITSKDGKGKIELYEK